VYGYPYYYWNGRNKNGDLCPDGMYNYNIWLKFKDGTYHTYIGTVEISKGGD
jgi:hypothetical protein